VTTVRTTIDEARDDARVDAILAGTSSRERVVHAGRVVFVHAIPETAIAHLHADAKIRAAERFAAGGVEPDDAALDELSTRMLERALLVEACRVNDAPLFASVADVERLEANELATLLEAFRVAGQRAGVLPSPDDDKLDEVVQRVAKRRPIDHLRARHSDLASFFGLRSAREASSLMTLYFATCYRGPTA
jgi:hypothetical protein